MTTLRKRVQELNKEYWEAREGGMSERIAVAQTHLYLASIEGYKPESSDPGLPDPQTPRLHVITEDE